ncbi:hypothetical protein IJI55_01740 [Candidatus Saccharibacteria bacterium]|nr:hypothetical protein [Candidatus Saccharibacteria bacterium]
MDQITYQHTESASGKWAKMPVSLQMGNIGSEVSRALKWQEKGKLPRRDACIDRALELFDLSITCNKGPKLKEFCRAREEFCDYFFNNNSLHTDPAKMQRYYDQFVMLNRKTL